MTAVDLGALAQRVASELARADVARPGETRATTVVERGPAPSAPLTVPSSPVPRGVSFVRDQARIADFIDHTLLKPEATRRDVEQLCTEARDNRFAAVCVNPVWVPLCHELLSGSGVKVATVIGFPLGANQPESKAAEAALAVRQGAGECDMVAALGHIKSADWGHVARDIEAV
ncbi:MAG: deoxyribose-phosphate aldolase, partial [Gemmatimonadota bacterium]|nr:deoxyribose-phosphate aldolase [Gemmatimonadota bacterium]